MCSNQHSSQWDGRIKLAKEGIKRIYERQENEKKAIKEEMLIVENKILYSRIEDLKATIKELKSHIRQLRANDSVKDKQIEKIEKYSEDFLSIMVFCFFFFVGGLMISNYH